MEYLKIVKNDVIKSSTNMYTYLEFDSCGYMARFKVVNGTLFLYCGMKGKYPLATGETIDFIGKVSFYGTAEIQYILFDKV